MTQPLTQTSGNRKLKEFEVRLTGGHQPGENIYFTGGKLTGSVRMDVAFPIKRVLRVVLKWVQVAKLGNVTKKDSHKVILLGREGARSIYTLQVDEPRDVQFSVDLPDHLLPSATCKSHFVRYYCQAKIVRKARKGKTISTDPQEFQVYQDNVSVRNEVISHQSHEDHEEILKPLRISYQLYKTGLYLGETPTIVGDVYNSGKSSARMKIGIDVLQTTRIKGEVNLLVTKLQVNSKKSSTGFGPWSKELKVRSGTSEQFSAEINLKSMPPTSHSREVDITYQVVLKLLIERDVPLLKPKQFTFYHDIIVGKSDTPRGSMRKTPSNVSFGRASLKKKTPPAKSQTRQLSFQKDTPPRFDLDSPSVSNTSNVGCDYTPTSNNQEGGFSYTPTSNNHTGGYRYKSAPNNQTTVIHLNGYTPPPPYSGKH